MNPSAARLLREDCGTPLCICQPWADDTIEPHHHGVNCQSHMTLGVSPKPTRHVDRPDCWCRPRRSYVDPVNATGVWVHGGTQ